jgi:hypothetical protein
MKASPPPAARWLGLTQPPGQRLVFAVGDHRGEIGIARQHRRGPRRPSPRSGSRQACRLDQRQSAARTGFSAT